jgi:hydroxymethylpyrimidine pyrophosphatase-like HAD family hydrolase
MPWAGIVVTQDSPDYNYQLELRMIDDVGSGKPPAGSGDWHKFTGYPWFKALFVSRRCDEVEAYLCAQEYPDVEIVRSSSILMEMLPKGSSKGSALEAMYRAGLLLREKTVAIGDFNNDLEMLQAAGIGACVETAPEPLKKLAKYITCPCEQGALADLIGRLKKDYP